MIGDTIWGLSQFLSCLHPSRICNSIHSTPKINLHTTNTAFTHSLAILLWTYLLKVTGHGVIIFACQEDSVFNKCLLTEWYQNSTRRIAQMTALYKHGEFNGIFLPACFSCTVSKMLEGKSFEGRRRSVLSCCTAVLPGLRKLFPAQQSLFMNSCGMNFKVLKGISKPDSPVLMCVLP